MIKKVLYIIKIILSRIKMNFKNLKNILLDKEYLEKNKLHKKWFEINGDHTLRTQYRELNSNSIVFDVGGYKGQWSSDIFSKYLCTIYIFEPVELYYLDIKNRFQINNKIFIFNFGLSNISIIKKISLKDDSSSFYRDCSENADAQLVSFNEFIIKNKIKKIDLIKINIEGGEYDLLEDIIKNDFIYNICNIQIQFHKISKDSEIKMKYYQKLLSKTHILTFQYKFIWENWKLNK